MGILTFNFLMTINPIVRTHRFAKFESPSSNLQLCRRRRKVGARFSERRRFYCMSYGGEEQVDSPQELRVPSSWLEPSRAAEESAWLRATLHKWLDDEYCPEATNEEISRVAADSYYKALVEKRGDLGNHESQKSANQKALLSPSACSSLHQSSNLGFLSHPSFPHFLFLRFQI